MNLGYFKKLSARNTKWLFWGIAAASSLAVLYAHLRIVQIGHDYAGPLAPLDRIFDLSTSMFLVGAAFCVGRAITRRLSLEFANIAEEISVSVMVGTGILGLGILGLGLAGQLSILPVALLFILLLGLSHNEVIRLFAVMGEGFRSAIAAGERRGGILLFSALATLLILRAMAPPNNPDELIYHLAVPKRFVEQGGVHPVYDNALGNLPFLIHMIYAVCLLIKADIAARIFSLFLALTTALALYGFCARFLTRRIGMFAMLAFFGAGIVLEVAATTLIDVTLAGMLFVATYAMIVYLDTRRIGWLYTSALLSGFALGIKLTAGPWLVLLGIMFLAENSLRKIEPLSSVLKHGIVYVSIAATVASPWFIKNAIWFQNPIYPFVTGEVASYGAEGIRYFNFNDERKLDAHFNAARAAIPSTIKAQEKELEKAASFRPDWHPLRFWEYFYLHRWDGVNWFPNYLFLIAPLTILFIRQRWAVWLAFISVGFYLYIAGTSWVSRYLLPIYPTLTIVSVYGLSELADRIRAYVPAIADRLVGYAITIILFASFASSIVLMYLFNQFSFISGALSRHDFMNEKTQYVRAFDFINRNLPKNSRVMMLGEERSYDMRRDCIVNPGWNSTDWRRLLVRNESLDGVYQDMKRQGITHVLFNPRTFLIVAAMGREGSGGANAMYPSRLREGHADSYVQLRNWATFELYKGKFLTSIYSDENGYAIYKLK